MCLTIQNSILKAKQVVATNTRWILGKGNNIRFWEDVWLFDRPVCCDDNLVPFMEICKERFGFLVSHYWQQSSWVTLEDIDVVFSPLQQALLSFFVDQDHDDFFTWKMTSGYLFSVSSTIKVMSPPIPHPPVWAKAWSKILIPKINIFFCLLLQNKILTLDNLMRRGFQLVNRCFLCLDDSESILHLSLHCPFTSNIWSIILNLQSIDWVFLEKVEDFFTQWKFPSSNPILKNLWSLLLPFVSWQVWKERNNHIFRNVTCSFEIVFEKICRATRENLNLSIGDVGTFSLSYVKEEDNIVARKWGLQVDISNYKVKNSRDGIVWYYPPEGWMKINFDGAAKENPSRAGCGGVTRFYNVICVATITSPLGIQSNHIAEAMGVLKTLKVARQLKINKVWIEGDSLNIIRCLKRQDKPSWNSKNIILNCLKVIDDFED